MDFERIFSGFRVDSGGFRWIRGFPGRLLTEFLLFSLRFIRIGGYKLLNTWLTGSKAANNVPFLQQLLLTLQHLPLTVDHLKQVWGGFGDTLGVFGDTTGGFWGLPGSLLSPPDPSFPFQNNTAKLVKQLSKSSDDEGEQRPPETSPKSP